MKKYILSIAILPLLLVANPLISYSSEEVQGEIINVNYHYKIAFTDLNSSDLEIGDIVKIKKDNKFIGYLEVSEVSSTISKLIPVKQRSKYFTDLNFDVIKIGCEITKVSNNGKNIREVNLYDQDETRKDYKTRNTSEDRKKRDDYQMTERSNLEENRDYQKEELLSNEIERLNKKYNELSANLEKILIEKKFLESDYSQSRRELDKSKSRIQDLEDQNSFYLKQIEKLKEVNNNLKNDDCKDRLDKMQIIINTLKTKLNNLKILIKKEL